jgi:regulator of RNase E activity RraA
VCIPRHLAEEVAEAAREQEKLERFIQYEVSNGAPLRGTYPPNEDTLERYRESPFSR